MKKLFLLASFMMLVLFVDAQNDYSQWQVGISGGRMVYNGDKGNSFFDFDQPSQGHVGLRISKYLNKNFDLYLGGTMGRHGFTGVTMENEQDFLGDVTQVALGAQYKILKNKFKPFVSAGLGFQSFANVENGADESSFKIPVGLGIKWQILDRLDLWWHSAYSLYFGDDYDGLSPDLNVQNVGVGEDGNDANLLHELGFGINLGRQDRDGDKVGDRKDECPDIPGLKEFNGCPDSDGDGIKDELDDCPNVAGLAQFNGCPDTDGDGVIDKNDECPEEAGPVDGCPDGDGDGVADIKDDCPEVAGLSQFKGCPDTDGDGVIDKDDNCPDVAGPVAGCPDGDGDGVADINDECPEVAGDMANGCKSDTDDDGVPDDEDMCPEVAGNLNGCPDSDKDGVADKDDKCPNRGGNVDANGCPKRIYIAPYYFDSGSRNIFAKSDFNDVLDNVVAIMGANPTITVSVNGHTDDRGSESGNQKLSEKRAKQVMEYLIKKGVDPARLNSAGYGESQPIGDNTTAEGRKQNRRVEFIAKFP